MTVYFDARERALLCLCKNSKFSNRLFSGKFPAKRFLENPKTAGIVRLFSCLLLPWSMYVLSALVS